MSAFSLMDTERASLDEALAALPSKVRDRESRATHASGGSFRCVRLPRSCGSPSVPFLIVFGHSRRVAHAAPVAAPALGGKAPY